MTTVYLIRHAQCDGNLYRQYDGWYNTPLTPFGRQQAAALAKRFETIHLDAVYSSDQTRAMETACAVAGPKGMAVQPHRGLRETNLGIWDHMDWGDIRALWPGQTEVYAKQMHIWKALGAERLRDVGCRVVDALWEIARANDGKTVAVVSHGDVIQMAVGLLRGKTLEQLGHTGNYSTNTAVTRLEFDGGQVRFVFEYDFTHLPPELVSRFENDQKWGMRYRLLGFNDAFPLEGAENVPDRTEGIWIAGYLRDEPAALVQLRSTACGEPGEIGFYWIVPEFRGRRIGIQPMGKVVDTLRALGAPSVRICLKDEKMRDYFAKRDDFHPIGGDVWERPIPPLAVLEP